MKKTISIKLYLIVIIFVNKTIPSENSVFFHCLKQTSTKCIEEIESVIYQNISIQTRESIFQKNIQNCIKLYNKCSSKELLKKTPASKEIKSRTIKSYQTAMKENDFRDSF